MPDSQPFIENRDAGTLAQAIVDTVGNLFSYSTRTFAYSPRAAHSIRRSRLFRAPLKVSSFVNLEMVNGPFPGSGCCSKGSFRSMA
jgi:hypothetical protein